MTVRINFLPKTYRPPKRLGLKEWAAAAGVALAVVGTTTYYMTAFAGVARLEQQIVVAQGRHQQVKAMLAQAAAVKAREERVVTAKADLKALQGRHWSGILLTLGDLTPKHVVWTSVKIEGDRIALVATSRGLVDVAQLFGGLVDHNEVAEVVLKYVDENGTQMQITAKSGDSTAKQNNALSLLAPRQMKFEMVITLTPLHEEGQNEHGA